MSSLTDKIDRFARNTRSISVAANTKTTSTGPFTRAILSEPLGNLIRDVHPSETSLFTVQGGRAEFHGATPLRKPAHRRQEHDPEVYARAAMHYIDTYRSIRRMPRAASQVEVMLEQIEAVKQNIVGLSNTLKQQPQVVTEAPPLRAQADDEERKVQRLQARIAELKKRKEAGVKPVPKTPAAPKTKTEEDQFWNTPAASARTLQFTGDSLMDEVVDLADVSVTSPMANRTSAPLDDLEQPQEEEEYTIVPQKPTASFSPSQQPVQQHIIESEPSPVQNPPVYTAAVSVEMERIAAKIWATMGDTIMPGCAFDTSGNGQPKPPRAKETFAHLQHIASMTPGSGLSSDSTTDLPTSQQILIAFLLVTLMSNPPDFTMPMAQIKALLAEKAGMDGSDATGVQRIVYACVGKRLLQRKGVMVGFSN